MELEDISLDAMMEEEDALQNLDLSGYGEVDDTISEPHFKVSTKQFKEALKVAKTVCATAGRDVISKAVALKAVGDKLLMQATDFDVYLSQKLELLNLENVLTDVVIVPIDIFIKLSKAAPVNTIIYKDDGSYKMRLYGGDISLETYSVDATKFEFTDEVVKETTVASTNLYSVVKDFSAVVTNAVTPSERRVICEKDAAYAFYMWGVIKSPANFADMDLKVKDISVLKSLLVNTDEDVEVFTTAKDVKTKRKQFVGTNFVYTFLVSDSSIPDIAKNDISKVVSGSGVFVDFVQLFKLVDIASELPYSMGKVGFNYNEDGVSMTIKTKKGSDSLFVLNGSKEGTTDVLTNEIVVSAKLLRVFLRSFSAQSSVKLSISTNGLGVSCNSYLSAIYPENK